MKKRRKTTVGEIDFTLFAIILLILTVGVVMVYSASSWVSSVNKNDATSLFKKQAMWAVVGIVGMLVAMSFDYHKLKKITGILMLLCIPALIAVFFFEPVNGATRWIPLGFASIQPSEVTKYVMVLYLAKSIDLKGKKIKTFRYGIVPNLLVAGFYAGMVLAERNLSIASVIMIVTLILLMVGGASLVQLIGLAAPAFTALGMFFIFSTDYRKARVLNFLDPWKDPTGKGYQLIQSLIALGSGGINGLGLGQSRQKCFYIPEPHTDFIFAIIGEELGFIGCSIVIALFIVLLWRGVSIAMKAKDTYGFLLATGITSMIAVQAIINMAVVTGSMPVTGVPLPLISYGGSSLLFNMLALGILLNISRHNKREVNNLKEVNITK